MSQGNDPFEFIRNFWANVPGMGGSAGAAPAMPTFDPAELQKRVGELKQVKQWLEMNLNMLNMQINTLEMQLTAVHSFENYTHNATQNNTRRAAPRETRDSFEMHEEPQPEDHNAPPDMHQANEAAAGAAKAASEAGAEAIAQGAQALQSMPWANPGDWIKSMQAAFGAAGPPLKPKPKAAAKKSKAKSTGPARKTSPSATPPSSRPSAARPAASRAGTAKRSRKAS